MSLDFRPRQLSESALQDRLEYADKLEKLLANDKNWPVLPDRFLSDSVIMTVSCRYEFPTPQDYRNARRNGTGGFKKPWSNDKARLVSFAGRDGHVVELRVIEPATRPSVGVWLHFHAGKESHPLLEPVTHVSALLAS